MNNWTLKTHSPQAHRIVFDGVKKGWEGWALLMSDEHVDSADCDRDLIAKHHREAKERNAPVFKFGDTFDAMQGKWDKRADQHALRPEHRGNNYLDQLVTTTGEFYAPWASQIALITPGNHEASIELRHQTSLLDRLLGFLRATTKRDIAKGSYSGFVNFAFKTGPRDFAASKTLRWHHGYGGGGEVTRGMIDNSRTARQAMADIYYSGHVHRRNMDENVITGLNHQMRVEDTTQLFLRGSAYKDEHKTGGGWHVAQGREGRPKGGWWLQFRYLNNAVSVTPIPAL